MYFGAACDGKETQNFNWRIQKTLHSWCKRSVAYSIRNTNDFVRYVFREHNQEADGLANLGEEGKSKVTRTLRGGKQYVAIGTAAQRKTEAVVVVL